MLYGKNNQTKTGTRMFQLRTVPFACEYEPAITCPVSVVLSERDPHQSCVAEAIPCHRCPHYLAQAESLWAQRRVQLGPRGRQMLTLARQHRDPYYPLTSELRTDACQHVDLNRVREIVQSLVALRALRTFRLPAVVPCVGHPQRLAVRETLWIQITIVGEILADVPRGTHGGRWRHHHDALRAHFRTQHERLEALDLVAVYVELVVALVTAVTHQLIAATDTVMVNRFTAPESPYVEAFVHLETVAPDAHVQLQQMYLRAQEARRHAITFWHTAVQHGHTSRPVPPRSPATASGSESG
jgi:hypothetical protein